MALLRLNENTGEVFVSDEGKQLPSIRSLLKKDHTKLKTYYNASLRYIYHVYKKDHDLSFLSFNTRKQRVINDYVEKHSFERFDNDRYIAAVVKDFLEQQYTPNELFFESIKKDFDELRDYIKEIPLTKRFKFEKVVEVTFQHEDKPVIKEVLIKENIKIDNSKEKFEALKRAGELMDLSNLFQEKIKADSKLKKEKQYNSLIQEGKI